MSYKPLTEENCKDFEKYGNYIPNFNHYFSTAHFFDIINREWLRQLTVLKLEYWK